MTTAAGDEFRLSPSYYLEEDEDFDRVRRLVGVAVTVAVYDESGNLEMRFADGTVIRSGPGSGCEVWNYAGPNGVKIICLPSGGLMTFSATPDVSEKTQAATDVAGAALLVEAEEYRRRTAAPERP